MNEERNPRTLTLNKEFKRAYYQGKSKATPYFIFYKIKNRSEESAMELLLPKNWEMRCSGIAREEFCVSLFFLSYQDFKTIVIMSWWPGTEF